MKLTRVKARVFKACGIKIWNKLIFLSKKQEGYDESKAGE